MINCTMSQTFAFSKASTIQEVEMLFKAAGLFAQGSSITIECHDRTTQNFMSRAFKSADPRFLENVGVEIFLPADFKNCI